MNRCFYLKDQILTNPLLESQTFLFHSLYPIHVAVRPGKQCPWFQGWFRVSGKNHLGNHHPSNRKQTTIMVISLSALTGLWFKGTHLHLLRVHSTRSSLCCGCSKARMAERWLTLTSIKGRSTVVSIQHFSYSLPLAKCPSYIMVANIGVSLHPAFLLSSLCGQWILSWVTGLKQITSIILL